MAEKEQKNKGKKIAPKSSSSRHQAKHRSSSQSKSPSSKPSQSKQGHETVHSDKKKPKEKLFDWYAFHAKHTERQPKKKTSDYAYLEGGGYNINFNKEAGVANASAMDYVGHFLAILINIFIVHPVALCIRIGMGILSCDHKNIGLSYLALGFLGISYALFMDIPLGLEHYELGLQYFQTEQGTSDGTRWIGLVNQQQIVMFYYGIIPAVLCGLAVYFLPLTIGAIEMAYPRLTALGLWLYGGSLVLVIWALNKPMATGWILDGHWLSHTSEITADLLLFALILWGFSMVITALVLVVTLKQMRAINMTATRIPLFCWGVGMGSVLMVMGGLFFLGALWFIIIQRYSDVDMIWNTTIDPILYDHFMAIFVSSSGYAVLLPIIGLTSQVLATTSKKPIFGYTTTLISMGILAILAVFSWASSLVPLGIGYSLHTFAVMMTLLKIIPVMMIVLSWIGTIWGGTLTAMVTMFWAKLFVILFALSQLAHSLLTPLNIDIPVLHVYSVAVFGGVMGLYYWIGKMTGRIAPEWAGFLHIWLTIASLLVFLVPFYMLTILNLPVNTMDYVGDYAILYKWMTLGRYGLLLSCGYCFMLMVWTMIYGEKVDANYWGRSAQGLEWTVGSPPPAVTFERQPTL